MFTRTPPRHGALWEEQKKKLGLDVAVEEDYRDIEQGLDDLPRQSIELCGSLPPSLDGGSDPGGNSPIITVSSSPNDIAHMVSPASPQYDAHNAHGAYSGPHRINYPYDDTHGDAHDPHRMHHQADDNV